MKRLITSTFAAALFLTSCLLPGQKASPTPEPVTTESGPDFKNGLMPESKEIVDSLSNASIYTINFNIADDMYHISGSESVEYTNTEEVTLNEIQLRLFPNVQGGSMSVKNVQIDKNEVTPQYDLENSLLIIPLSAPLQPNEKLTLSMDFEAEITQNINLNYGVQAFYDNVLALAHAYPMIAVYDDEGWNSEIAPQSGDVTYADMSFFIVTVEAPKDVVLVTTGRETRHEENGNRQTVKIIAGPVRDFYLAASSEYQVVTSSVNSVALRFYYREGMRKAADEALQVAIKAVEHFSERYAPYPYSELDFVATPNQALGIEYPGMIAITDRIMEPGHPYLEATVAHEVGHQWFYNLVGNDQLDEPWLDESLTQFATLQYFEDEYGKNGFEGYRASLEGRWANTGNALKPVGLPVRDYSGPEYSGIVYGRGPLFFIALREEMGTDVFDSFLKNYTQDYAWKISTSQLLQKEAEAACTCDLSDIFNEWVYPK